MKKVFCFVVALNLTIILTFNLFASADSETHVKFQYATGSTEFHATGHPSALHVVGKGSGPVGEMVVGKTSSDGTLSFDLSTLDTGIETRDEHMKNKYLEVGKYPKAQLVISKMAVTQDQITKPCSISDTPFQGTLSLHGVSKPIGGTVTIQGDGKGTLSIDAKFGLKLSDFAIAIPSFAGVTIADQVQVEVISKPQVPVAN